MELAAIGRALRPGGALTLVGDAGQQVDETAWFAGWAAALSEVGCASAVAAQLKGSRRCPPPVYALAQALRNRTALPASTSAALRQAHSSERKLRRELAQWLRAHPSGQSVVVGYTERCARRLHRLLPADLQPRLCLDPARSLVGRVAVTTVAHVRGLEAARVAIPDVSPDGWPATEPARRALYVALTRATEKVWLGTVGQWSAVLP